MVVCFGFFFFLSGGICERMQLPNTKWRTLRNPATRELHQVHRSWRNAVISIVLISNAAVFQAVPRVRKPSVLLALLVLFEVYYGLTGC